jgi:hypothetical protein
MQRNRIIEIVNIRKYLPRISKENLEDRFRICNFAKIFKALKDLLQKFVTSADRIDNVTDHVIWECKETGLLKSSAFENIFLGHPKKILKIY